MKYRKKPVVIDAVHYLGNNSQDVIEILGLVWNKDFYFTETGGIVLHTLESNEFVISAGDYVIKGVKGEFYACKPDIFELTYEPVTE